MRLARGTTRLPGAPRGAVAFLLLLGSPMDLAGATTVSRAATRPAGAGVAASPGATRSPAPKGPVVVLETVVGDIAIALYPADAPQTVANFKKLVARGFYDSLTFHRVVPGFVIQGGDPNSRDLNPFNDGQGGPGWTVPAEVKRRHRKGAVAMARLPDAVNPRRASNGSQFYIALKDLPQLDGGYTVFGRVAAGWDAVERIVALSDLKTIARQGNNANPGRLAMIRHARLAPSLAAAHLAPPARADSARAPAP